MNYYDVTFRSQETDLIHYGVKGQRHGIRRYQNEDGSLTSEGRDHYGVGEARRIGLSERLGSFRNNRQSHNYRVKRFGKSSAKVLGRKPENLSPQQKAERDARKKKIIAAAALTAVAAIGVGAAVSQHQKTTRNLMYMAKRKVHKDYITKQNELDRRVDLTKYERNVEQAKLSSNRTKAMMGIYSRGSAKKALGLSGKGSRQKTRSYIEENRLNRIRTSELMEKMSGQHLVDGVHAVRRNGKLRMEPYSERTRRRLAEHTARAYFRSI